MNPEKFRELFLTNGLVMPSENSVGVISLDGIDIVNQASHIVGLGIALIGINKAMNMLNREYTAVHHFDSNRFKFLKLLKTHYPKKEAVRRYNKLTSKTRKQLPRIYKKRIMKAKGLK